MQLITKFNKGTRFSLCVIDIFSKYAWVVPLKEKGPLLYLIVVGGGISRRVGIFINLHKLGRIIIK